MPARVTSQPLTPEQIVHLTNLHVEVEQAIMPSIISDFTCYGIEGDAFARRVQKFEQFFAETSIPPAEQRALRDAIDAYLADADVAQEVHMDIIKAAAVCVSRVLTPAWVGALSSAVSQRSTAGAWLRVDVLDEALLPRADEATAKHFATALALIGGDTVTAEEARKLLQDVREKAGAQVLPTALSSFLATRGIVVVR